MKCYKIGSFIKYIFLIVLAAVTIFPVLFVVSGAFKPLREIMLGGINIFPKQITLENFKQAWIFANFKAYTLNSIYYSATIVVISIITSTMAGFAFEIGNFPGKKFWFAIFMGTMFLAMGSASLYPTLKIAGILHLNNSIWGVVVIRAFGINITNVLLTKGFIKTLPAAMYEAAVIDGCNLFELFTKITMPLLKPMIATLAILSFRSSWNEYLLPMIFTIGNPSQTPLSVGLVNLKNSGGVATDWGIIYAGACYCLIPILAVYCAFNKYFVDGITAGSVKE